MSRNDAFRLEFFISAHGEEYHGFRHEFAFSAKPESTADSLVFDVRLGSEVAEANGDPIAGSMVFKYTVCFCDAQKDAQLSDGQAEDVRRGGGGQSAGSRLCAWLQATPKRSSWTPSRQLVWDGGRQGRQGATGVKQQQQDNK